MRRFSSLSPVRSTILVSMLSVLVSFVMVLGASSAAAQQATPTPLPHYTVTDLGTLSGRTSGAYEINSHGHVVGLSDVVSASDATPDASAAPTSHGFLWRDGTMTDLGTLGGANSFGSGINDADQIVGDSDTADGKSHAFLWQDGTMTDLGTLGGDQSYAVRVNNAGQIAGLSTTAPGQELGDPGTHAVLWDKGTMTDLGTLGGEFSRANAINDDGQLVGAAETTDGATHPVLWDKGTMTDLGVVTGFNGARALRITANGVICGFTQDPAGTPVPAGGERHAFLFREGAFTDLGTLGGPNSFGFGVNATAQVVGTSDIPAGTSPSQQTTHGFLWMDGTLIDLNDLLVPGSGWEIVGMASITDSGQIVGGASANGVEHAVLLTPQA